MENNNSINVKGLIKDRERIFKEIARNPRDLTTLRAYAIKKKIVESGGKFDKAIAMLKASGRIIVKPGRVEVNPNEIRQGVFVMKGRGGYIQLDGDNRQFSISNEDSQGFKSNERVNISFTDNEVMRRPFIVSSYEGEDDSIRTNMPKLERDSVLGRVIKISHDKLAFIPNDRRFTQEITILNPKNTLSKYQDKICVMKITDEEKFGMPAAGIITEIRGDAGNPIHEYEAIAETHGANMSWSDEAVQEEISKIPTEVDLSGYALVDESGKVIKEGDEKIVDLRSLSFTTVDPATCKDMDDAIYSTFDENGNIVVYTAVANVTKYVDLNSEIGKRYLNAGFTTYAPNRAYNILPPELSTGICSLNPNVDRLALVVKNVIDKDTGLPISTTIMDAVINSKEKYSYEQAQQIVDRTNLTDAQLFEKAREGSISKEEQVVLNERAAKILWKGFNERKMINFETKDEYDVIFNDDLSEIVDIQPQENCAYHKVIEAFMLTANESAARFAKEHSLPNIYRVHQGPNEEKLAQAYEFFGYLGIPFDGDLTPSGIAKLTDIVRGTHMEKTVNKFLVRMQSRAKYSSSTNPNSADFVRKIVSQYSPKAMSTSKKENLTNNVNQTSNVSHFGLQSKAYSHTTSPIRRISDYVTHKNILAFLKGKELISEINVAEIANWANEMQDINKEAEREFVDVSSAIYCENHIGETMTGYISGFRLKNEIEGFSGGVDNLAVVVENEQKGIKVLVPASEFLPKGVKNVAMSKFGSAIVSKSTNKPVIRLCDEVTFKINSANRLTRVVTATTDLEKEIIDDNLNQNSENGHEKI